MQRLTEAGWTVKKILTLDLNCGAPAIAKYLADQMVKTPVEYRELCGFINELEDHVAALRRKKGMTVSSVTHEVERVMADLVNRVRKASVTPEESVAHRKHLVQRIVADMDDAFEVLKMGGTI